MSGIVWSEAAAPTLADFEQLAASAWERIPATFRDLCGGILFRVEEFATDEVLASLGIESPFDLMGLYQGVSLDKKCVSDPSQQPDMVILYRRALLDYWAEGDETLEQYPIKRDRLGDRLIGWNCSSLLILEHLYRTCEPPKRFRQVR